MASSNKQMGPTKKISTSPAVPVLKTVLDTVVPKTPTDVAITLAGGKAFRVVGGIVGKGAKYVSKLYR
jgi:hypothetical protein